MITSHILEIVVQVWSIDTDIQNYDPPCVWLYLLLDSKMITFYLSQQEKTSRLESRRRFSAFPFVPYLNGKTDQKSR